MKTVLVCISSALLLMSAGPAANAQAFTAQEHSQDLASAFTKVKDKVKDKNGVHTEAHVNLTSRPWLAAAPAAYAGTYAVEGLGFALTLEALPTGELSLRGSDPAADGLSPDRPVSFRNVKLQDGLLTATKVDELGLTQPFTAAFLTQARNGTVRQGLGTRLPKPVELNGLVLEKLFYQKQP
ncbi:MAG: hypothetical protein JWR44_3111 [Hymenobacter sp.]|jgi:hypothetical protein|nr:hypothetical protein [Hymenobacter sp.]